MADQYIHSPIGSESPNFRLERSHLRSRFDSRFPEHSRREAQQFGQDATAAMNALGARPGTVAARHNPMRWGSAASRFASSMFGPAVQGAYDATNRAILGLRQQQQPGATSMARRALGRRFSNALSEERDFFPY